MLSKTIENYNINKAINRNLIQRTKILTIINKHMLLHSQALYRN